ncbi:MAG: hypothetical protein NZ841_06190 [Dictyoglomus sp.]|nr:hypothetical protein [Dictyoglomus sp.]MDW8188867.1 hypothetical protein [Dictyoglomus sp.]
MKKEQDLYHILWFRTYNIRHKIEIRIDNGEEFCLGKEEFLEKAQRWQDTWNLARPSFGIGMNGKFLSSSSYS